MIATKFAQDIDPDTRQPRGRMLTPDEIAGAVDGSLRRLGLEVIDLYYQHRVNPDVPIEEMAGAVKDLVDAGKISTSACRRPPPTPSAAPTPSSR